MMPCDDLLRDEAVIDLFAEMVGLIRKFIYEMSLVMPQAERLRVEDCP